MKTEETLQTLADDVKRTSLEFADAQTLYSDAESARRSASELLAVAEKSHHDATVRLLDHVNGRINPRLS